MTGVRLTSRNRLKPASAASCRTAAAPAWAASARRRRRQPGLRRHRAHTERGFLAALGRAIGALPPGASRPMATVADAAGALSGLGDRVVLVLDTYEQLRLLDTWLRQELVPGLRDNTRLALAGREPSRS